MREPRKLRVVGDSGGCRRPPPALRWVAAVLGLVMAAFMAATLWAILTAIHWGTKQALTELAYLVIVCTVGCGGMLFAWSIYRGGFDGPTDLLGPTLMRTVPGLVLSGVTAGALALSMGRYAYVSDASLPYVLSCDPVGGGRAAVAEAGVPAVAGRARSGERWTGDRDHPVDTGKDLGVNQEAVSMALLTASFLGCEGGVVVGLGSGCDVGFGGSAGGCGPGSWACVVFAVAS